MATFAAPSSDTTTAKTDRIFMALSFWSIRPRGQRQLKRADDVLEMPSNVRLRFCAIASFCAVLRQREASLLNYSSCRSQPRPRRVVPKCQRIDAIYVGIWYAVQRGHRGEPEPCQLVELSGWFRGGTVGSIVQQVELAGDFRPHALAFQIPGLLEIARFGGNDILRASAEARPAKPGVDHDRFFGGYPHGSWLSAAKPAVAMGARMKKSIAAIVTPDRGVLASRIASYCTRMLWMNSDARVSERRIVARRG